MTSPFIYGRPVRPGEFLNRKPELRTIFNRLRNGESTAVVGEPHIGKTSLLLQLADPATRRVYLGDDARCLVVSPLDLHPIGSDYTPTTFWEEALEPLREHPGDAATARRLKQAAQTNYARRSLERLFNHLGAQRRRLLLLLDEFERLLIHPNFQDPAFFAMLRSLVTRTGGLALVTASRLSVAEMNERGRGLLDTGSPFFNNVIEVRLRPFDEETVNALLDQAGEALSPDDRRFIRRVAGRHPFLLQAMAEALVETTSDDRQAHAAECFYGWVSSHFDDLWHSLDDRTRTTAVILSLVELCGRALGQDFAFGEIEKVEAFGPELRKLAERGLAEQVDEGWQFDGEHLLLWRGERWTVGAQAFAWWVRDVVIAGARRVPTYDEWLANKRYLFLLTQEQWNWLVGTVRNAPEWAVRGVGALG
ncbi:MAG: AAA-like domain-containing protein, partial [Anaerolineae bacterium]|nr:AAA-like domain-containing protein [Anaerolineae bacterium]